MTQSKQYANRSKQKQKYILSLPFILTQEQAKYIDDEKE